MHCHLPGWRGVLFMTLAFIHLRVNTTLLSAYLFRDLGGNSNSPTEMVSTALREILMTCWHNRLMKSYLHTSSDLPTQPKDDKLCQQTTSQVICHVAFFLKLGISKNILFDLPISYKHKSLLLIVPVVNSVEAPQKIDKNGSYFLTAKHNFKPCLNFFWHTGSPSQTSASCFRLVIRQSHAAGILTQPAARHWAPLHPQKGVPPSWCRSQPAQWYLAEISITQPSIIISIMSEREDSVPFIPVIPWL